MFVIIISVAIMTSYIEEESTAHSLYQKVVQD